MNFTQAETHARLPTSKEMEGTRTTVVAAPDFKMGLILCVCDITNEIITSDVIMIVDP